MRARMSWAVCLLGLGLASVGHAAEVQEVVDAIEAKYSTVESIQASFVQTKHSEIFGSEEQRGTLLLKRPAKMRWEFTSGVEKQFITNGKTMWVYTQADNQAIRFDDVSSSGAADSLLQSLDKLDEMFKVQLLDVESGYHLQLLPREGEQRFKRLELVLDDSLNVKHLEFVDAFDSVTELEFSDVKLNVGVLDTVFEFKVPEGVEVISTSDL